MKSSRFMGAWAEVKKRGAAPCEKFSIDKISDSTLSTIAFTGKYNIQRVYMGSGLPLPKVLLWLFLGSHHLAQPVSISSSSIQRAGFPPPERILVFILFVTL